MSQQIRAYRLKHGEGNVVAGIMEAYRNMLQTAIDKIWGEVKWREEKNQGRFKGKGSRRNASRLIPLLPVEGAFKHHTLRNSLMNGWSYSKHYVDSAIKQAYSILNSWQRNYVKGYRRAEKPTVRRRFVRVKETLYSYKNGVIKISMKPNKEYVEFDVSKAWFQGRAEGSMGELILREDSLTITFRKELMLETPARRVAWDSNEASLDAFDPKLGWVRVDLSKAYHIHRTYEQKRKRLQKNASKKPNLKTKLEKYSRREQNRIKDLIHKETSVLARYPLQHYFENLDKQQMYTRGRSHNRNLAKSDWKMVQTFLVYKTGRPVKFLNPFNSTRRCSRCGGVNKALNGATILLCGCCGLRVDRQLNAAINLYLQMEGLTPSPTLFQGLTGRWSGFTQTGEEADEGLNELTRGLRLMNPQSYECLHMTT